MLPAFTTQLTFRIRIILHFQHPVFCLMCRAVVRDSSLLIVSFALLQIPRFVCSADHAIVDLCYCVLYPSYQYYLGFSFHSPLFELMPGLWQGKEALISRELGIRATKCNGAVTAWACIFQMLLRGAARSGNPADCAGDWIATLRSQ